MSTLRPSSRNRIPLRISLNRWDTPLGSGSFWQRVRPEQLFVASFASLLIVGTLGLKLIPGMTRDEPIRWVDALFTITSAVCVTGLTSVNTAEFFTPQGQAWILLFIQLGGLGVIVLSSFIILALGGRLSLRATSLASGVGDVAPELNRFKLIRDIIIFTLLIEAAGATILYNLWRPWQREFGMSVGESVWHALFHAVSAFCNAGFSTYRDNLMDYSHSSASLMVIGTLVVLGGIGFLVMEELYRRVQRRTLRRAMSVHTKLVVVTTIALLLIPWPIYMAMEWNNGATLGPMDWWDKVWNGLFFSITPRTAGFNTVDYEQAYASTNFLSMLLMSIGGSPGSTAGGLKTTTFALIVLLAISRLRKRSITSVWSRTIPEETIQRAIGLAVVCFALVTLGTFLLTLTERRGLAPGEPERLLPVMFEAVSAFNTVGLSLNVSPGLTDPGKVIVVLLMFLGRVGPLTFAAAIALADVSSDRRFRYAKEDVVVG